MKKLSYLLALLMLLGLWTLTVAAADKEGANVLSYKVKDIKGQEVDLAKYKGKVLLIVNVASRCGFTPQYEQLEAVYKKYADQGLAVLGFPANNFGAQEPGTNEEILEFCSAKFKVSFDMFAKISVKGDDIDPLYKALTAPETNGPFGGDIQWNFTKFLVGRDGKVCARFEPKTTPDDPQALKALEEQLARKL